MTIITVNFSDTFREQHLTRTITSFMRQAISPASQAIDNISFFEFHNVAHAVSA
jgi:hypothetical protein